MKSFVEWMQHRIIEAAKEGYELPQSQVEIAQDAWYAASEVGWLPIETALEDDDVKNGGLVITYGGGYEYELAELWGGEWRRYPTGSRFSPTHWTPLPKRP